MDRIFAWAGGVFFVTSLAFWAFMYFVTWSRSGVAPLNWTAIAWDALLFSMFAVHHSLFARSSIKQALARYVPERLLRSVYVWVASALLVLVCVLWRPIGGDIFDETGVLYAAHVIVQLLGVGLIARSVAGIDALELAGIRQVRAARRDTTATGATPTASLQTGGVYRLVRHPLYLGWVLVVFGVAHMTGDRLSFAVISVLYLAIAVPWEERSLQDAFGEEYARYQRAVRWRMIPFIY